jgi:GNAT superfamily N-acetyltransferase
VVHPDARGSGAGRRLVEHCLQRAREVGAPALGIHTIELLDDAVRLYERVGFVRCPEFDMPAADVFPSQDADDSLDGLAFRHDL